jgi:hypothetical protein
LRPSFARLIFALSAPSVLLAALACGQDTESEAVDPGDQAVATAEVEPASAVTESPDYDSTATMFGLYSGVYHDTAATEAALQTVLDRRDKSLVPVLVEMLRFREFYRDWEDIAAVLRELTGQELGGNDWTRWTEWLGNHRDELRPPARYAEWKIEVLSTVDPRFAVFLRNAEETARIDLTEVVWGNVEVDGIPDLQSPRTLRAEDAGFLKPHERVLGLSIAGWHRAYPMRIVNAHEMVNDILGGEPIVVAW